MKSYAICPISEKLMDERVARMNASITVMLLLLSGLLQSIWLVVFLSADFLLRGLDLASYSPLAILSRNVLKAFNVEKITINAGPKMFAARIGFIFTLLVIILSIIEKPLAANIVASVLGLFCFLEAAFSLCVACKLYPFVYRFLYRN